MVGAIELARGINTLSGGAVIAPWEIGQIDEAWLELFRLMIYEAPGRQAQKKQVDDAMQKYRDKWNAEYKRHVH